MLNLKLIGGWLNKESRKDFMKIINVRKSYRRIAHQYKAGDKSRFKRKSKFDEILTQACIQECNKLMTMALCIQVLGW